MAINAFRWCKHSSFPNINLDPPTLTDGDIIMG